MIEQRGAARNEFVEFESFRIDFLQNTPGVRDDVLPECTLRKRAFLGQSLGKHFETQFQKPMKLLQKRQFDPRKLRFEAFDFFLAPITLQAVPVSESEDIYLVDPQAAQLIGCGIGI